MKWLVTILAILVGVLLITTVKLAGVKHDVDPSPEALREMATLRKALQVCEAVKKPQADLDAPAPAPALEETNRPREMRGPEGKKRKMLA